MNGFRRETGLAAIIIATSTENIKRKKRRKRKEWVKPWLQGRNSHGFHLGNLRKLSSHIIGEL